MALPSAADMVFIALLGVFVFTPLAVRLLADAGIGWHIRNGQQILATHAIPRMDPFSSTMAGKPWYAWEWLYDAVVGQLEAALGLNGVVWFTAVALGAVFSLVFRFLIVRGSNLFVALLLVLLAISASMVHFLARPHVVSWLFTLAWFWVLDSAERTGSDDHARARRWLWALPVLMVAWVNIHGGFAVGFVLLGIFWLGALWEWVSTKGGRIEELLANIAAGKRLQTLTWVGLASVVASLLNPYGWKLHAHVFSYLSNRFLMDHIDEFQSPNFHFVAQKCFLALLLIVVAVLMVRGRQLRMSQRLAVLFAIYGGLYASRNIPVASILLVMVIGLLFPELGRFEPLARRMGAVEAGRRGFVWPIVAILATFLIAANGGRVGSSVLMNAHFDPNRMPVEAVDYLQKAMIADPVLSTDSWGGYLIYRLYPKTKVVVDDRHDLYGADFFKSYLKMVRVEDGWQGFLTTRDIGCVVLPRNSALANVLLQSEKWKALYRDDVAIVLARDR